jgi:hypothetical protein
MLVFTSKSTSHTHASLPSFNVISSFGQIFYFSALGKTLEVVVLQIPQTTTSSYDD